MFGAYILTPNQQNLIVFVLTDSNGSEVSGLGTTWTAEIFKTTGAFGASAGTKAEIGDGWYSYLTTAGETDTYGPGGLKITHGSIVQQNIPFVVGGLAINAVEYTYTVTEDDGVTPIEGVSVWFCIDSAGNRVAQYGVSDAFGVTRIPNSNLKPRLDPGTYQLFRQKAGYTFDDPDTEVVS